jgi:hypothetical protein
MSTSKDSTLFQGEAPVQNTRALVSVLAYAAFTSFAFPMFAAAQTSDPGPPGASGGPFTCVSADATPPAVAIASPATGFWSALARDACRFTPESWLTAQVQAHFGRALRVAPAANRISLPPAGRSRTVRARGVVR